MKRRMFRRSVALLLALVLTLSLGLAASAATELDTEGRADALHALNLFQGTGSKNGKPVYSLEAEPTRLHGLVMLIRLLGQEAAAKQTAELNPFADVNENHDDYGIPYLAYAYAKGLTQGRSATRFDPDTGLAARDYVTFLLRSLGYDDKAGDFSWAESLSFAASISLVSPAAATALEQRKLTRGDMVDLSYAALCRSVRDGSGTLAERLCAEGVFDRAAGAAAGVLGSGAGWTYEIPVPKVEPVQYEVRTVSTSRGDLKAHVVTVNMADRHVRVRSALVDGTLGHTANFSDIVAASGCVAAINGNFFESYKDFKRPIGHVMVDGVFQYANSGLSSLGITRDGRAMIGRLPVFTSIHVSNGDSWVAYEVNTEDGQSAAGSILYLPSYGQELTVTAAGSVMIARGGVLNEYRAVEPGERLTIPADGFVFFVGPDYMAEEWNKEPTLGVSVTGFEPYLFRPTEDSFPLDGVVSVVSGGPRLVTNGAMDTTLESAFSDAGRFGPNAAAQRTAVGVRADGALLLVSVPNGATIQQMRELMLALECRDAFNLDGGASCAMYANGTTVVKPGRQLTVTLQVFVDD